MRHVPQIMAEFARVVTKGKIMNAKKAILEWESRDSIDAFQPWELVEIIDALASYYYERNAAEHSMEPTCSTCGGKLVAGKCFNLNCVAFV